MELKIILFLFILCVLNSFRELWVLLKSVYQRQNNEISPMRLLLLGMSLSYIFTILISGFKL